jgi:hypothetical protein
MTKDTKKAIEEFKPGVYKHFKGNNYLALMLSTDCEDTDKKYVIYITLYENEHSTVWSREVTDFMGYKKFEDGTKVKRFKFEKPIQ